MTSPGEDRVAAKVEELDRLIAELQMRRRALLEAGPATVVAPAPPKKEAAEAKAPAKVERPLQVRAQTSVPARAKNALEMTLDSLPWKSFKKKEGEWAFLRDREGRLIDELQSEKEFVDRTRKEGQVVVGKYRYQVSEDKFLNRYFAGA
ncbi:MAG TPA: hypothetical protein VND41_03720 [Nitrososphaerales archaeon]|nr:hypothetical protein [Nitrososphaerales archaeon]